MVLPQEKMKEQLRQVGGGGGQAETHPYPPEAAVNSPAPPSGNTAAPIGAAPAQSGAKGSQGGAGDPQMDGMGTPDEKLKQSGPVENLNIATTSIAAVSNTGATAKNKEANAQKNQVNENMSAQGMSPKAALKELVDENVKELEALRKADEIPYKHYTELKNRWKNIYNIIPEEDMGLFLMDFGFRLMMAGETMGDLGAIGAAGGGALAAQQGRRQATSDRRVSDYQAAQKSGLEEYKAIATPPEEQETTAGLRTWNVKEQKWEFAKDPDTGERLHGVGSYNRPYSKEVLLNLLTAAGPDGKPFMGENAALQVIAGGDDPGTIVADAGDAFDALIARDVYPNAMRPSAWRALTDAQREKHENEFIQKRVNRIKEAFIQSRGGSGAGALAQDEKPADMSDEEWAELKALESDPALQR